jgi:dTDP-4-amino-4,6-dideoxygalactose transaminase
MQAAIGRVALKRLNEWVQRRRMLATILAQGFQEIPALRVTIPPDHMYHSYYKYYVFVRPEKLKPVWNRDRILTELEERGVPCGTGVCPEIYLEKMFKNCDCKIGIGNHDLDNERLPVAKMLGETSLMFMVHPTLAEENMEYVVKQVKEVMSHASKK